MATFKLWDDKLFKEGSKLSPITNYESYKNKDINGLYLYLGKNINKDAIDGIVFNIQNVTNSVIVGDGQTINFVDVDQQYSPIKHIDQNSYIAGLVIFANSVEDFANSSEYVNNNKEIKVVAGLVQINQGIVYSCNVRGRNSTSEKSFPLKV